MYAIYWKMQRLENLLEVLKCFLFNINNNKAKVPEQK